MQACHRCQRDKLSLAGYLAAAGPSAKARSTLAVTCRVNALQAAAIPQW